VRIATYNINGVNGRLTQLLDWLALAAPDVVCLQELKADTAKFPRAALEKAGYGAVWNGQRANNGVAILARDAQPIVTRRALPGDAADTQSRYIEAAIEGVLVACLYAPNGNPQPGPRFQYKLRWLERLLAHAAELFATGLPVVLAGDYNVVPTDFDIYDAKSSWKDDALLQPPARDAYARLLAQGWCDALRERHPDARIYTFWDYLRNAWQRDAGLRLDHLLLSKPLTARLGEAGVDREERGRAHASDHAPAWIDLR
jgi:exodeoxyribonuclease III